MPIGIRFDDCPHKAAASVPPRKRQIAAHRGQVDHSGYRAWHRNLRGELTLNSIVPPVIDRAYLRDITPPKRSVMKRGNSWETFRLFRQHQPIAR
jgi:hypothetical protein